MSQSEIVLFHTEQTLREEAAILGLCGPALVARHDFIEARAERGAAQIVQLLSQGKDAEAQAQMELPDWGGEEERGSAMSHFDTMYHC